MTFSTSSCCSPPPSTNSNHSASSASFLCENEQEAPFSSTSSWSLLSLLQRGRREMHNDSAETRVLTSSLFVLRDLRSDSPLLNRQTMPPRNSTSPTPSPSWLFQEEQESNGDDHDNYDDHHDAPLNNNVKNNDDYCSLHSTLQSVLHIIDQALLITEREDDDNPRNLTTPKHRAAGGNRSVSQNGLTLR